MTTDHRCPDCGGTLTVVAEGQTEQQVWVAAVYRVVTFVVPRAFVSCDRCEWIFDGRNR